VLNFDGDRAFVTHLRRSGRRAVKVELWREVLRREQPRWCYLHVGEGVTDFLRDAASWVRVVLDVSLGDERYGRSPRRPWPSLRPE
jgi:hypothetical protein